MAFFRCEHTIRKSRRDVPIRKMLTTIGRAPGNDIVLDDRMTRRAFHERTALID